MPASYGDRDQDQGLRRPILGSGGPAMASASLGAVVLIPADPHHLLLQELSESRELALTGVGHGQPSSGDIFHAASNSRSAPASPTSSRPSPQGLSGTGHRWPPPPRASPSPQCWEGTAAPPVLGHSPLPLSSPSFIHIKVPCSHLLKSTGLGRVSAGMFGLTSPWRERLH